jgi:hypothetical protein
MEDHNPGRPRPPAHLLDERMRINDGVAPPNFMMLALQ